jgi:hypothetical protein
MPGLAFPSGHAFTSTVVHLAIAYILTIQVKRWPYELLIIYCYIVYYLFGGHFTYLSWRPLSNRCERRYIFWRYLGHVGYDHFRILQKRSARRKA